MKLALKIALLLFVAAASFAETIGPLELRTQASVSSRGVFLNDLVTSKNGEPLPQIQLAPAPQIGRALSLTRYQVADLLTQKAPDLSCTNWAGADKIRVTRVTRVVDENILRPLLQEKLQDESVKTRGELELRFTKAWNNLIVSDDALTLKILDIPSSGVSPMFICRFELFAGEESAGIFQQPLQAKIWKEVYVARSNITRGQSLRDADLVLERRDILTTRDYVANAPLDDPFIEFRENVMAGTPLNSRMLRLRAVVKRGKLVDAMLQDESLSISVKAEALEDGVPGQPIRLRNIKSKKEFRGKVQDEQTVLVMF